MNRKIRVLAVILLLLFLAGCGGSEAVWSPLTGEGHIRIAVLGDDDFYLEGGTTEAMELAAEDFRQETGVPIDLVYCDDDADYHKAIAWAKSLAAHPEITAVISKQEIDFIDTVADMLEDAKKPYVVLSGCYNHTIEHGYDYLLADFIHARAAGKIMGRYVTSRGFRRAAFCHSDTEYEEDELKGFQDQVSGTDTVLADTVVGPFTQQEFNVAYARWVALGIDVVCVSNYYVMNSDLVRMLRQEGSDIQVVSDYVMETTEDIEKNGAYMDGTVIVPLYIVGQGADDGTQARFQEKYGMEMLEVAIQAYDIVQMLGRAAISEPQTPEDLMAALKSKTGYRGISGTIRFDQSGALLSSESRVLRFSNGGFRPLGGEE